MVESEFKKQTLAVIISCILLCFVFLLYLIFSGVHSIPLYASMPIILFLIFILVWLVYGELRLKAIKVIINQDKVTVINFWGRGAATSYTFKEIDGYKTAILPSEYNEYEYLYLFTGRKKIIRLSQFYPCNYTDVKKSITGKVKNLGEEPFSIFREIKGIFIS